MTAERVKQLLAKLRTTRNETKEGVLESLAVTLLQQEELTVPTRDRDEQSQRAVVRSVNETLRSQGVTRVTLADLHAVQAYLKDKGAS